ncbi:MAG TPA: DUF1579 family protein [Vicinamibacteria bacterium]|nr:DUF1579 family protein [Vicinamibacteria bacterium]
MLELALLLMLLETAQQERDEVAAEILAALEGEWRFELAGRTGTRTARTVFPSILVSWSERFDDGSTRGEGLEGYDREKGEFFSSSVHDVPGAYGMMVGGFDPEERVVTYVPLRSRENETNYRVRFHMPDQDAFSYTMLEQLDDGTWAERWTARFQRARAPPRERWDGAEAAASSNAMSDDPTVRPDGLRRQAFTQLFRGNLDEARATRRRSPDICRAPARRGQCSERSGLRPSRKGRVGGSAVGCPARPSRRPDHFGEYRGLYLSALAHAHLEQWDDQPQRRKILGEKTCVT